MSQHGNVTLAAARCRAVVVLAVALLTSMMLVQHTEFEHGSGTETFTFAVSRDGITLLGYFIQSMELVTT